MDNLRRIDLNLLVTLEALLIERNVTRAAQRLHLSQPSVSVQLRKLREIFGDPLLSPAPGGMLPTARAEALLQPLRAVLADMRRVLAPTSHFDPSTADLTWRIAASDYSQHAILLPMLPQLRKAAPYARLAIHEAAHSRLMRQLESGGIDLGILAIDAPPTGFRCHTLYKERYVLVARKRHPQLKRKLTLETFCQLDYAIVSTEGGSFRGVVDSVLESQGYRRRVVLSVPYFLYVPQVVAHTDIVALLPSRLVKHLSGDLQIIEPPLRVPCFDMAMIWHERSHLDPAHAWLREQITSML